MKWILRSSRRLLRLVIALLTVTAVTTLTSAAAQASWEHPLVVTFTFDDGVSDQAAVGPIFATYGMAATIYVNSAFVGEPGYLTRTQLRELAARGNEIGGHTVSHQDLSTLAPDERNRQICQDRNTLLSWGFNVTSFAYPFASLSPDIEATAEHCGYNSARTVGNLRSPSGCPTCVRTDDLPVAAPFAIRTPGDAASTWTLAQLQSLVTDAESVGGWLPFNLHHICGGAGCPAQSISPDVLGSFLAWLKPRLANGTGVGTVAQVIGGPTRPAVAPAAPLPPGPPGVNTVRNASLETPAAADPSLPDCFSVGGYGTITAAQTRVTDAHTGTYASRITVTARTDGDAKLLPRMDLGQCSNQVAPGRTYEVSAWYRATVPVFFTLYQRNAVGQWTYWTQSPPLAAKSAWTRAAWVTPVPPAGAVAASFGLTIDGVGTLTTGDYGFADHASP